MNGIKLGRTILLSSKPDIKYSISFTIVVGANFEQLQIIV